MSGKRIVIGGLIAVALVAGSVGYVTYERQVQAEQQKKIQEQREKQARIQAKIRAEKEAYRKELIETGQLLKDTFYSVDSIARGYSSVAKEFYQYGYAVIYGVYHYRLDDAIFYEQTMRKEDLDAIRNNLDKVKKKLAKLNEPTKEFAEAFNKLLRLQEITTKYYSMINDPNVDVWELEMKMGEFNSEFEAQYSTFETIIPKVPSSS